MRFALTVLAWTPVAIMVGIFLLLATTMFTMRADVNTMMTRAFGEDSPLRSMSRYGGPDAGGDKAALLALRGKLRKLAAHPYEAQRNHNALHVVLLRDPAILHLRYGTPKTNAATTQNEVLSPGGTVQTLAVDVTKAGSAATLIVHQSPTVVRVSAGTQQTAKIAFESRVPFDLLGADIGLLAGFRVTDFGGGKTMNVEVFEKFGSDKRATAHICRTLLGWQEFFGIGPRAIRLWDAGAATELLIAENVVSEKTEGGLQTVLSVGWFHHECMAPSARQYFRAQRDY